jgi:hypothetical protein
MAAKLFADTEVPSDFHGSYDLKLNVTKGLSTERAELPSCSYRRYTVRRRTARQDLTVTYRWEHPRNKTPYGRDLRTSW